MQPITGIIKRKLAKDLTLTLGIGISMGYLFWYGFHVPGVKKRDLFYERYAAAKKASE